MADIAPVTVENTGGKYLLVKWETLTQANAVGTWVDVGGAPDRTVHIFGTWNGATLVMQGSMDGITPFQLTDAQANSISKTDNAAEVLLETCRYIRPSSSGGGASTDIDVWLIAHARG